MFYSHEILSSHQYGVATIWIVATFGPKASTKKITRKAILEVNVPKACETIVQPPGAPIALRLQGNLLYGVSRVYDQQCGYMLTDTEKVQTQMRAFLNMIAGSLNALDPNAGRARRDHLMLGDDPDFELNLQLPGFHIDGDGNLFTPPSLTQATTKTSSQMSPLESGVSSSGRGSILGGFGLPQSSLGGSVHLPSPFGHGSMSLPKPADELLPLGEDDFLMPFDDIGLEIDADGNIVQVVQEPELPPLPPPGPAEHARQGSGRPAGAGQSRGVVDDQGDVIMNLGDEAPPNAEILSPRRQSRITAAEQFAVSSPPRRRRAPRLIEQDDAVRINRDEFQSWGTNYLANMANAHKPTLTVSSAKAKQNANNLLFGLGIANIGLPTSIPGVAHPLAGFFAGKALRTHLLGPEFAEEEEDGQRGRRRSSSQAFGNDEEERRVRQRVDEDGQQLGRTGDHDVLNIQGDEAPEIGREPGSALSDHHSSVPWNRPPSATRGSSVLSKTGGPGVSLLGRQISSPLVGRGNILPDIERLSDDALANFGSDGFQPLPEQNLLSSDHRPFGDISGIETSQALRDALDREGKNFLSFVGGIAAERGLSRSVGCEEDGNTGYRWVEFCDLFEEADSTKAVAAQAFFHVLTLVSRGALKVEQDQEEFTPFGNIRVGVKMLPLPQPAEAEEGKGDTQAPVTGQPPAAGATGEGHRDVDDLSDIYDP